MNKDAIVDQLATAGLIACLPTAIPLQDTISLIDSLLATPVFAVAVVGQTLNECESLIADLRQRGGSDVVVGAIIQTFEANRSTKLYSQFVVTADYASAVDALKNVLVLPAIRSIESARNFVQLTPPISAVMTSNVEQYQAIVDVDPQATWLPFGEIPSTAVPVWQAAGASSIGVPVWFSDDQLMPETITLARRYNAHFHPIS